MDAKILVAYASRAGSTSRVAEAIGKTLAESGAQVEVRLMKDVKDPAPYRVVVAGSAIQGGRWLHAKWLQALPRPIPQTRRLPITLRRLRVCFRLQALSSFRPDLHRC